VKKSAQPFMFHIGGPCLPTVGQSKSVIILFTATVSSVKYSCNFTNDAYGGCKLFYLMIFFSTLHYTKLMVLYFSLHNISVPSGLVWEQVTREPIISGFPISPELTLRVVDPYNNPITTDSAAGTVISATIATSDASATIASNPLTLYGSTKAVSSQGRLVFSNFAIAGKLATDPQNVALVVSSTPALIAPAPLIVPLQNGGMYYCYLSY